MEAINKNKEEIEKILKGCGVWSQGNIKGLTIQMQCGDDRFKDKIGLCEVCRAELKATIKTSIEWCEDEIKFLNERKKAYNDDERFMFSNFGERLEQLQTHLNWLKEQEKKQ